MLPGRARESVGGRRHISGSEVILSGSTHHHPGDDCRCPHTCEDVSNHSRRIQSSTTSLKVRPNVSGTADPRSVMGAIAFPTGSSREHRSGPGNERSADLPAVCSALAGSYVLTRPLKRRSVDAPVARPQPDFSVIIFASHWTG